MVKGLLQKILLKSAAVVIVFTILDYFFHSSNLAFNVPGMYFINKLLFGFVFLFVLFNFFSRLNLLVKSAITSFLLELRYLLIYPFVTNLIFLVFHFLVLAALIYCYEKLVEKG